MMERLRKRSEQSDPNRLSYGSTEVIADLAEAWAAAQEINAALRRKLDQT